MTPKQERFVQEYLIDLNGTQAAIRAGYSPHTAKVAATKDLLPNPAIAARIATARAKLSAKAAVSAEWILMRLKSVAERCMQAEPVFRQGVMVEGAYQFDAAGANRALELLGRHLGLFVDRVEHKSVGEYYIEYVEPAKVPAKDGGRVIEIE